MIIPTNNFWYAMVFPHQHSTFNIPHLPQGNTSEHPKFDTHTIQTRIPVPFIGANTLITDTTFDPMHQ